MLYHKSFENGNAETSGVVDVFDECTTHLEEADLKVNVYTIYIPLIWFLWYIKPYIYIYINNVNVGSYLSNLQ